MERSGLTQFAQDDLAGTEVRIERGQTDRKVYTLRYLAGRGATAVTWNAVDANQHQVALKLTPTAEYRHHTLSTESHLIGQLQTDRIARIDFFGDARCTERQELPWTDLTGIVVDWVEGDTLSTYLQRLPQLSPDTFMQFARDLCEIVDALEQADLTHNDLHDRNIMVVKERVFGRSEPVHRLTAVDTGQLKSLATRDQMLTNWRNRLSILNTLPIKSAPSVLAEIRKLTSTVRYFQRTDFEWLLNHLCSLFNAMHASRVACNLSGRRFLNSISAILRRTGIPSPAASADSAAALFARLQECHSQVHSSVIHDLKTPFDIGTAELFRSDSELMKLFQSNYPGIDTCRGPSPVHLFGPRGCGKTTVLRALSIKAILASPDPAASLSKVAFVGIYVSCSQELIARFKPQNDQPQLFKQIKASLIRYFNLLLVGALGDALSAIYDSDTRAPAGESLFGMSNDVATRCCQIIRERCAVEGDGSAVYAANPFSRLKVDLSTAQSQLWRCIVRRTVSGDLPDAQLLFDIAQALEIAWPYLAEKRLAFLLDDYSTQRIGESLQRELNPVITFSRNRHVTFKVSSEYDGLLFDGIDGSREVISVNIGWEWVVRAGEDRYQFLRSVLDTRFKHLGVDFDACEILPPSKLEPAGQLASEIRRKVRAREKSHYFGIDTLSDVCCGNVALGVEIVRQAFQLAKVDWRQPRPISAFHQHRAISQCASQQFAQIRQRSGFGEAAFKIATCLCKLSHDALMKAETRRRDEEPIPRVLTHIDIAECALEALRTRYPDSYVLFQELTRQGVLFFFDRSRAREEHEITQRYVINRILLAHHLAALGRDVPIRIDDVDRLNTLIQQPEQFSARELQAATGMLPGQRTMFGGENDE